MGGAGKLALVTVSLVSLLQKVFFTDFDLHNWHVPRLPSVNKHKSKHFLITALW